MKIEKRPEQEGVEEKPISDIEQHEADPTIALERATAEFGANSEKLDGLLKSEGGVDTLSPEDSEKWRNLADNMLIGAKAGLKMFGEAIAVSAGAFGAAEFVHLYGDSSFENTALGLAGVGAVMLIGKLVEGYIEVTKGWKEDSERDRKWMEGEERKSWREREIRAGRGVLPE